MDAEVASADKENKRSWFSVGAVVTRCLVLGTRHPELGVDVGHARLWFKSSRRTHIHTHLRLFPSPCTPHGPLRSPHPHSVYRVKNESSPASAGFGTAPCNSPSSCTKVTRGRQHILVTCRSRVYQRQSRDPSPRAPRSLGCRSRGCALR